jgi:hypothetical protein
MLETCSDAATWTGHFLGSECLLLWANHGSFPALERLDLSQWGSRSPADEETPRQNLDLSNRSMLGLVWAIVDDANGFFQYTTVPLVRYGDASAALV